MAKSSKKLAKTTEVNSELKKFLNPFIEKDDDVQEYFDRVKDKIVVTNKTLNKSQLDALPKYIENCKANGQKALVKYLKKNLVVLMRERRLLDFGIDKYIHVEDITKFIKRVKHHSIKICELENFPRIIPSDVVEKLNKCKENNLFDNYYVLFTDYTDEEFLTENQVKQRRVNKDPILFGTMEALEVRHYVIADWVDEYCDITLDKFINSCKEIDPKYKPGEITVDIEKYLNQSMKDVNHELEIDKKEKKKEQERFTRRKKTFLQRLVYLFTGD